MMPDHDLALRGYAICTAPRSGSNWLCQLLSSTGVLGRPLEYFNGFARRQLNDPSYPDDPHEQAARILTMGRTSNGVYGLKMFASQFKQVAGSIKLSRELPDLRFVFLRRQDVLGQAISWVRGLQTNQWRSTQTATGSMSYDGAMIAAQLRTIVEEYSQWTAYFARNGLAPVEILYEDMIKDPQAAIARVASLFDLTAFPRIGRDSGVDLKIQRDAVTDEWRARFIAEQGHADAM